MNSAVDASLIANIPCDRVERDIGFQMRFGNYWSKNLKGYALCRRPLLVSRDCHLGYLLPPV